MLHYWHKSRNCWGIHSPARKKAPFIGKNIVLGVSNEMIKQKGEVENAAEIISRAAYSGLSKRASANLKAALSHVETASPGSTLHGLGKEKINAALAEFSKNKYDKLGDTPTVTNNTTNTNKPTFNFNVQATINNDADVDRLAQQLGQKIAQQGVRWG